MAWVNILLLVFIGAATAQELQPSKVTASAECGGELRLTMKVPMLKAHSIDKRDVDEPSFLFDVSYKLAGSEKETTKQFAAFSARKGQYEAVLSGLQPGERYGIRVRLGMKEGGQVKWGRFSDEVKGVSGSILAEDGPVGIGEGRNYCLTRQRRSRNAVPKAKKRVPRFTYSRRRYYSSYYAYYYSYYNYYYCGYYTTNRCSTSAAGAIAGGVIGAIFLIAALVICFKCYYYGGCGRPAYRYHGRGTGFAVATASMTTSTATAPVTGSIPTAMPVAQPVAAGATVYPNPDKGVYETAPYPTKGGDSSATYGAAMYPPAPNYPAAAAASNPGYPSGYPAPPPYPGPQGQY